MMKINKIFGTSLKDGEKDVLTISNKFGNFWMLLILIIATIALIVIIIVWRKRNNVSELRIKIKAFNK